MTLRKRVLVTRAAHQGSALAEHLLALGLEPVLIPAIEMDSPTSYAPLDRALAELDKFDWLLFSSANAVDAVARRCGANPLRFAGKVAAIGPATAQALGQLGLAADLVPAQAVAESFAEALLPHAVAASQQTPVRFLLIRAEEGRDHLPDVLRAAGAEVVVVAAYRTVVPSGSIAQLRALLSEPERALDAVTFTSSSAVRNLLALCEAAGVELPHRVRRISIGPITSQTLRELGQSPDAEATEATVAALAKAVAAALSDQFV